MSRLQQPYLQERRQDDICSQPREHTLSFGLLKSGLNDVVTNHVLAGKFKIRAHAFNTDQQKAFRP